MESTPDRDTVPTPGPGELPASVPSLWGAPAEPAALQGRAGEMFVSAHGELGTEESVGSPLEVSISLGGGRAISLMYSPERGGIVLVSAVRNGEAAAISSPAGSGLALAVVPDPHDAG